MTVIYHAPDAASLVKLIVPFFLFNYLQTPLQSALVGMGQAKTAMFNNIIAKCTTVVLIYPLATNQRLGIYGVILAISIGIILETILHFSSVVKSIAFYPDIPYIIKILLAGIVMGFVGKFLFVNLNNTELKYPIMIIMLVSIMVSLLIYLKLLGYLKVIQRHDIVKIPGIGKILAFLFPY